MGEKIKDNWFSLVLIILVTAGVNIGAQAGFDKIDDSASKKDLSEVKTELEGDLKDVESDYKAADESIRETLKEKVSKDEFMAFKEQLKTISDYILNNKE